MYKLLISGLAAVSLGITASPAVAETATVGVAHADLNLSTPEGMATLEGRVRAAVRKVCGTAEIRRIRDSADQKRCTRQAQESASGEIARLAPGAALAVRAGR